jgi:hypothetical protein
MRKAIIWLQVPALAIVAGALLVSGEMSAREAASTAGASPEGGNFLLQGGALKAIAVRTWSGQRLVIGGSFWTRISQVRIDVVLPPGQTALLVASFTTDCWIYRKAGPDVVRYRVLDNGLPMEPYSGNQDFCAFPGTYTGEWAARVSGGSHAIRVDELLVDAAPTGNIVVENRNLHLKVAVYE